MCDAMSADDNSKPKALLDRNVAMLSSMFLARIRRARDGSGSAAMDSAWFSALTSFVEDVTGNMRPSSPDSTHCLAERMSQALFLNPGAVPV